MKRLLIVLAALAVSGCVRHTHTAVSDRYKPGYWVYAELAPQGSLALAVTTADLRPYVVSGEKRPSYVGRGFDTWGVVLDVGAPGGLPLAEEINSTIAVSLGRRGFKATAVSVIEEAAITMDARALAARTGADRVVLLRIDDWRSDTVLNTSLLFDMTLRVLDANGAELASSRVSGHENLGGFLDPLNARRVVPQALRRKLEELFRAPNVVAALR